MQIKFKVPWGEFKPGDETGDLAYTIASNLCFSGYAVEVKKKPEAAVASLDFPPKDKMIRVAKKKGQSPVEQPAASDRRSTEHGAHQNEEGLRPVASREGIQG